MSNGDAGIMTEGEINSAEKDLGKEFSQAAEIGRFVLKVAEERTKKPFSRGIKRYSFPMLNPEKFSQEDIAALTPPGEQINQEAIEAARKASALLAMESAAQIVEAKPPRPRGGLTAENSDSLIQMEKMVGRANGFMIQT